VVQVRDSRVLAAASHPLRRRLMDVLKVDGPATATMLAGATEQAVANVSHHLKVLSGAGLIVEVPERARNRRERWWTLASTALRWNHSDFHDDPVAQAVASAAASPCPTSDASGPTRRSPPTSGSR
jgi:DNA-binding transcriptional ArsR family regulator